MSDIQKEQALDKAVDLIIHQDRLIHRWIGYSISIQAGLAVAVAAVINWGNPSREWHAAIAVLLIATLAIVVICSLRRLLVRELEWQRAFIEMAKRSEGSDPILFGHEDVSRGPVHEGVLTRLSWLLSIAWALFALLYMILLVQWQNSFGPEGWPSVAILVGLLLNFAGAITISVPLLTTEDEAIDLGVSRWGSDKREEKLKQPAVQAILQQSRLARYGLVLLAIGFLLQIVGVAAQIVTA